MCYFYILYSKSLDRYYYGHTCDTTQERLRQHLNVHTGFTGKTKDWELAYTEPYSTKTEVYPRERQVKRWKNRKLVEKLIGD